MVTSIDKEHVVSKELFELMFTTHVIGFISIAYMLLIDKEKTRSYIHAFLQSNIMGQQPNVKEQL